MTNSTLQEYIPKIKSLQDKKRDLRKPFLLLIIIEMIENSELYENNIPFSEIQENKLSFFKDLIEVFNESNESPSWEPSISVPFSDLETSGFWYLNSPTTPTQMYAFDSPPVEQELPLTNDNVSAKLDDRLFILLAIPEYREILRQTIIDTYFPELREKINYLIEEQRKRKRKEIEKESKAYSELLIEGTDRPFSPRKEVESIQVEPPIRSAGFRRAIMKIYNYTCTVCELNIRALTGESLTDAAHIIPFSVSYNDDIRNGISLCKLHHWAFDRGLISLNEEYQVIVSSSMCERGPTRWRLIELRDKLIRCPKNKQHYPAQDALAWHRERVLRQ